MKLLTLLLALCMPVAAWSSEACKELGQAQQELQTLLNTLAKHPGQSKYFKKQLQKAQQAWNKSVQAQIQLAYPNPNPKQEYGTAYEDCVCSLKADYTALRIQELHRYLKQVPEGEVCAVPGLRQ